MRLQVVRELSHHVNQLLQMGQIHRAQKYASCLTFSVIDPCDEIKTIAKEFLNSFISVQRRNASMIIQTQSPVAVQTALPEFMLSYLVYIIAHHDNFPNVSFKILISLDFDYRVNWWLIMVVECMIISSRCCCLVWSL